MHAISIGIELKRTWIINTDWPGGNWDSISIIPNCLTILFDKYFNEKVVLEYTPNKHSDSLSIILFTWRQSVYWDQYCVPHVVCETVRQFVIEWCHACGLWLVCLKVLLQNYSITPVTDTQSLGFALTLMITIWDSKCFVWKSFQSFVWFCYWF